MLFLFLLPVIATGLKLTPPENIWVSGENKISYIITHHTGVEAAMYDVEH